MPALADYSTLYYDLKCINVFRQAKLTNQQYKELVSKIEVRPYTKDEVIMELDTNTKAALYLVVSGSVWLGRGGSAPVKLPSGCNFGEELLKAAEGVSSALITSPYSVTAADDSCVCAVLTMDACREVFDIDGAEKQKDAHSMGYTSPKFEDGNKPVLSNVKVIKAKKKKKDDDASVVSNKSTTSKSGTKSKLKKKKSEKKSEKKNKAEEKPRIEIKAAPKLDSSADTLDLETANEEEMIIDLKPDPAKPEDLDTSVTIADIEQQNSFELNSNASFTDPKSSVGSQSTSDLQIDSSSSVIEKKFPAAPMSAPTTRRRWGKHMSNSSTKPSVPGIMEESGNGDTDAVSKLRMKSPTVEPGKYHGPVRARRGSVAERFLNKVSAASEPNDPTPAEGLVDIVDDSESDRNGTETPEIVQESPIPAPPHPPPPPLEKRIMSPVKNARSRFEHQIKRNDNLKKQASASVLTEDNLKKQTSAGSPQDDDREHGGEDKIPKNVEEEEDESKQIKAHEPQTYEVSPLVPPLQPDSAVSTEAEDSESKDNKNSKTKSPSKASKRSIAEDTSLFATSPQKPKLVKMKKDDGSEPGISPRRKKEKSSFIARLAKFESQAIRNGPPLTRPAGNVYQPPTNVPKDFTPPVHEKTEKEEKMLKTALKKRFVFESLPEETINGLTSAFEKTNIDAGTMLFNQGDKDEYFYVIGNGEVAFQIDGENQGVAKSGESFGEEALLHNSRRQASVLVVEDSELYKFDKTTFRHLLQNQATKSAGHKRELLEKLDFLETASPEQLQKLSNLMTVVKFKKGETLAKQEDFGKNFFVIADGQVECTDVKLGRISKPNKVLGEGEYFGKQALLEEPPIMKANVVALTNGTAYKVTSDQRTDSMGQTLVPIQTRTLHAVKAFERKPDRPLKHSDIMTLSRAIKNVEYEKGDTIIEDGEDVEAAVYFVRSGRVHETKGRNLLMYSEGGHFGESLFISAREQKSLKGKSDSKFTADSDCVLGAIQIKDYYSCFDDEFVIPEVKTPPATPPASPKTTPKKDMPKKDNEMAQSLESPKPKKMKEAKAKKEEKSRKKEEKAKKEDKKKKKKESISDGENDVLRSPKKKKMDVNIKLENLEKRVCLGEGEFGQVWLVTDKAAPEQIPYVLKIQSKYHLLTEGEVEICKREKDVLLDVNHPFIINMFRTYQDPSFVFMLMDFVQGGELFSLLNNDEGRVKLEENKARFYALGIADALAHLHDKRYVYRDLKPENVMIDALGYPKVIDFGFAKKVEDKTFTLCGTPGYLAPEIVVSQGHSWPADHWALGILSFEMLMGFSPFYEDGIEQFELYRCIVEDDFPKMKGISSAAQDFISKLLEKDPNNRLGSLSRGERDILSHKWFADLSTRMLRERKIEPPWKPEIKNPFDTSNFDDWSGVEDKMLDKGPPLREKDAALFEGF